MISLVRAELLFRRGRLVATLAAVAVAVASFALLASAARGSRLRATDTVRANYRPVYDILVRPADTPAGSGGLLAGDALTSTYGGISRTQWAKIQRVPGVSVAAPVATVGYVLQSAAVTVDLTRYLDPALDEQVIRIQPSYVTDRGTTRLVDGAVYFYATHDRLEYIPGEPWEVGKVYDSTTGFPKPAEIDDHHPDGRVSTVCEPPTHYFTGVDPLAPGQRMDAVCWSSDPQSSANHTVSPQVTLLFSIPLLVAAVDPAQEARLDHLDAALTSGGYLAADDRAAGLPVLASSRLGLDAQLSIAAQRLPAPAADATTAGGRFDNLLPYFDTLDGTALDTRVVTADSVYPQILATIRQPPTPGTAGSGVSAIWTAGPVTVSAGQVTTQPYSGAEWGEVCNDCLSSSGLPLGLVDTPARNLVRYAVPVNPTGTKPETFLRGVGVFDPTRVDTGPALSQLPFDLYGSAGAPGADAASRTALGNRALLPNTNFAGAIGATPALLTSLAALDRLAGYTESSTGTHPVVDPDAPISAVRVRVTGDVGMDPLSQQRLVTVADQIRLATGLRVDLVVGSSATGVPALLPTGDHGRPALTVAQPWLKLGVATVIVSAVDRKSLVLAILVLVACALAIGNATSAAVRTRRTQLGVLACLGWPRRRLFGLVLLESLTVGTVAGVAGAVLAVALALALHIDLAFSFALLAVPAAVLLSLCAALVPAWRATRADPAAAIRPPVAAVRRRQVPRRVSGLALGNVLRSPGRTAVGAVSLAIGVAALTLLVIINLAFQGTVSGTVLGDAITLQAQTTDYIAAALTTLLGAATVADVLYVDIRERAAEFALLDATGWGDGALARLAGYEAVAMGLVGALAGAAAAVGAAAGLGAALPAVAYLTAGVAVLAGTLLTTVAAILPVRALRRLPTARLLAEE